MLNLMATLSTSQWILLLLGSVFLTIAIMMLVVLIFFRRMNKDIASLAERIAEKEDIAATAPDAAGSEQVADLSLKVSEIARSTMVRFDAQQEDIERIRGGVEQIRVILANSEGNENFVVPEGMKLVPEDYEKVPAGMKLVPENYEAVPEGMKVVPMDYEEVPEGMKVVSEDMQEGVVYNNEPQKSLEEKYADLSKEQKSFFDALKEYALSKEGAAESQTHSELTVKALKHPILRLGIQKNIVVAKFKIENDLLKNYRRENSENNSTKIKVKDTVIKVVDLDAFETAKGLVDVMLENNEREAQAMLEARKQRRREAQAARRAAKKAEA